MSPAERLKLERQLSKIADELEAVALRERALFEVRLQVWKRAVEAGVSKADLAKMSRLKEITVRQLIQRSQ